MMYNLIFGCSNTIHNLWVAYICWKQSVCAPLQYGAPHSALVYVGHVSVGHFLWGLCSLSLSLSLLHIAAVRSQKPGSFQEPRWRTFPPKEWDPSWISQVSGWHNTRANHFVLNLPTLFSFTIQVTFLCRAGTWPISQQCGVYIRSSVRVNVQEERSSGSTSQVK